MDHIKIADSSPLIHYIADGVTTSFTFPFPIFKAEDLAVYENKTQTFDYSISGAGDSCGGTVTLAVPPVVGTILTLWRQLGLRRQSDFIEGGALRSDVLNDELDQITAMIQQVAEASGRALSLSPHVVTPPDLTLPEPVAGRALVWNDDASRLVNSAGAVDASNPGAAAGVYFTPTGSSLLRSVASRLRERRSVLDFIPADLHDGIRDGSNPTDLTVYLQTAFDNFVGYFPVGAYRISAGLHFRGPVLIMEDGAYLAPDGSGYTALTIRANGAYTAGWHITIRKVDWSIFPGNGIFWDNPANANIESLKVYSCDGFGVKLARMWDCHIGSISTVRCGNSDHYAFSIEDGGDCSNMSFIGHIQAELSNAKAIYISPNTRHVVFNSIHSERTIALEGVQSYELSGALCSYHNVRLTNHDDTAYGRINMEIADSEIHSMCVENPIPLTVSAGADLAAYFVNCQFSGPVSTTPSQLGNISFQRCRFFDLSLSTGGKGWLVQDCDINGTLSLGYVTYSTPGDFITDIRSHALRRHFGNCRIASLTTSSNAAAASFSDCFISALSATFYYAVYDNCNITGSITCLGASYVEMRGCRLIGTLVGGYHGQGWIADSAIIGNVMSDGSSQQPFAFANVRVSGSINSVFSTAPNWGAWLKGQICDRMPPAAGSPIGWVFNGATWLARPNL